MSLLDQLPRLSAYDPGAVGEGGLDPLGLAATADRIANMLAPGLRARMSQPRFVTLSAVGAIAYQTLHEFTADQGKTTVDLAFEWLVVEAMVRNPGNGRTQGLPGNMKAARAKAAGQRLSRRTYLNGPRVFGFTGVYRPFSRDAGVLTMDDRPAVNSGLLIEAWESDFGLKGYVSGIGGTPGGRLRSDITDACRRTLEAAESAAPSAGKLLRDLAEYLAPREARANEKRVLREFITTSAHEIRNELAAKLLASSPPEGATQRELASLLLPRSSAPIRRALQAAIDYEEAATVLDNAWRRFIAYVAQQQGAVVSPSEALRAPRLAELAPRIEGLVKCAMESVAELDDVGLAHETVTAFRLFTRRLTPAQFFDALIERHEQVQADKGKICWLDQIAGDWTVRTPYRHQSGDLDDAVWVHPMRLTTLLQFLAATA